MFRLPRRAGKGWSEGEWGGLGGGARGGVRGGWKGRGGRLRTHPHAARLQRGGWCEGRFLREVSVQPARCETKFQPKQSNRAVKI